MHDKLKGALAAGAAIAALGLGGAAIAGAAGGGDGSAADPAATHETERGDNGKSEERGDSSKPVTGGALDKAGAVALKATGGGRVTDSELQDEEGYYEIEVTRTDGSQVDVHLDRDFNVLNTSADGSGDN